MGQSLVKNYLHITYSTKYRQPFIYPEIENELYAYLGGICKNLECPPIRIGGHYDHVHILCMLSKKIMLMDLMKYLKMESSLWIKTKSEKLRHFYWQDGYAAFSVNPAEINRVVDYIARQKEHHRHRAFQIELLELLKNNDVEYDERYLWD